MDVNFFQNLQIYFYFLALFAELECVTDQVYEDLLIATRIALNRTKTQSIILLELRHNKSDALQFRNM